MLDGPSAMGAFVADRAHDRGLIVGPAMKGNAGQRPQSGAGAIGGHQQARPETLVIRCRHDDLAGRRLETRD